MGPDFFDRLRGLVSKFANKIPLPTSRRQRVVPTVEEARARPGAPLPVAVLDSINRVLGEPSQAPVSTKIGLSHVGGGFFDPGPRTVVVNPTSVFNQELASLPPINAENVDANMARAHERIGEVLAHELAHDAVRDEIGGFKRGSLQGFTARFLDRFSALPESTQRQHFARYAPGLGDEYMGTQRQKQEIVAKTLEVGFALARQADPDDPQQVADLVRQVEKEFPGTREAYNFWIRRLRQESAAPGPSALEPVPARPRR